MVVEAAVNMEVVVGQGGTIVTTTTITTIVIVTAVRTEGATVAVDHLITAVALSGTMTETTEGDEAREGKEEQKVRPYLPGR